jgi:two-component system OmpR family response regulator
MARRLLIEDDAETAEEVLGCMCSRNMSGKNVGRTRLGMFGKRFEILGGAMKILLIEDDDETGRYIADGLTRQGHVVDLAANGRDGLFLAAGEPYDVMVVDRLLPGLDGLAVVKTIRGAGIKTPVLFLTALDGVDDRVEGLEAGGDDYLVKPFAFAELMARINALARRPALAEGDTVLRVGDLELDLLRRSCRHGRLEVGLQAREFRLLEYLMRHPGQVVTRTMLLEHVWDFHFDPRTTVVETHISRLRAKLGAGEGEQAVIETVRGAGYRLRDAPRLA